MKPVLAAALMALSVSAAAPRPAQAPASLPVIDIHRHAPRIGSDDVAARSRALESMRTNNIVRSLIYLNEPSDVTDWAAPDGTFIAIAAVPCWRNRDQSYYCFTEQGGWPELGWLERELAADRISGLGEMLFNYANIAPDDPRMAPYWALAAKYDVPVFIHTGRGPGPGEGPREDPNCCVNYNEQMGNPALLRRILREHPSLRIVLLHFGAGSPEHPYFREEALALMRDYPNVFVDLTILNSLAPIEAYEAELRRLIDDGFGSRILFGTDNLPPELILKRLMAVEWMSDEQRRNILHDNAVRFLRLERDPVVPGTRH